MTPPPPTSTLFPYTTLFRSPRFPRAAACALLMHCAQAPGADAAAGGPRGRPHAPAWTGTPERSEEHTSELQSRGQLVCRLLLEKKNITAPTEKYNYVASSSS